MSARMTPDEIRRQAIDAMKNGGLEICERAIRKWLRGDYLKETDAISAFVANWKDTAREISVLAEFMKGRGK